MSFRRFVLPALLLALAASTTIGCAAETTEEVADEGSAVSASESAPKSQKELEAVLRDPTKLDGASAEIVTFEGAKGAWHVYPWAGAGADPTVLEPTKQYLAVGPDALFLFGADGVAGAVGANGDLAAAAKDFGAGGNGGVRAQMLRPQAGAGSVIAAEIEVLVKLAVQAFGHGADVVSVTVKTQTAVAVEKSAEASAKASAQGGGSTAAKTATASGADAIQKFGPRAGVASKLGKITASATDLADMGITREALEKLGEKIPGKVVVGGRAAQDLFASAGHKVECPSELLEAWAALPGRPPQGAFLGAFGSDRIPGYRNVRINTPGPAWDLVSEATDDVVLTRSYASTVWYYADEFVVGPWRGILREANTEARDPALWQGFELQGALIGAVRQLQSGRRPLVTIFRGSLSDAEIEATIRNFIANVNRTYVETGTPLTREALNVRIVAGGA